jgi:hypothetical protein
MIVDTNYSGFFATSASFKCLTSHLALLNPEMDSDLNALASNGIRRQTHEMCSWYLAVVNAMIFGRRQMTSEASVRRCGDTSKFAQMESFRAEKRILVALLGGSRDTNDLCKYVRSCMSGWDMTRHWAQSWSQQTGVKHGGYRLQQTSTHDTQCITISFLRYF